MLAISEEEVPNETLLSAFFKILMEEGLLFRKAVDEPCSSKNNAGWNWTNSLACADTGAGCRL